MTPFREFAPTCVLKATRFEERSLVQNEFRILDLRGDAANDIRDHTAARFIEVEYGGSHGNSRIRSLAPLAKRLMGSS